MILTSLIAAALLSASAIMGRAHPRAATCIVPTATDNVTYDKPYTIASGKSFDGGNARYGRGVICGEQSEGGDSDAVFLLEDGASLSNVIIGTDQSEGIHCLGSCDLTNIWFEDVCEDAMTFKQESGTSTITGGAAFAAEDKVLQHNGGGNLVVDSFCVENFGKLYRSCGNCKTMYERHVVFSNIVASNGGALAGINSNYGDTAIFDMSTITTDDVNSICDTYEGNASGDEPPKLTSNETNEFCQF